MVRASAAVVTTSDWTRRWLLGAYGLDPGRVHVARPGVDPATTATGSADGGNLLNVGAVTPGKGHDLLVGALARVADLPWRCVCVGPLTRSPDFVAALQDGHPRRPAWTTGSGWSDRAPARTWTGAYSAADVLVLASRAETYGMVVTEALARGLPVLAYDVGGVSEALGLGADGSRPGVLVPAGDVERARRGGAAAGWATPALRRRLRAAAAERRRG